MFISMCTKLSNRIGYLFAHTKFNATFVPYCNTMHPIKKKLHEQKPRGLRIYKDHVPDDVYKILIQEQAKVRVTKVSFSLEDTIYKLIREGVR